MDTEKKRKVSGKKGKEKKELKEKGRERESRTKGEKNDF